MLGVLNKRLNAAQMTPNFVALLFAVYDSTLQQMIVANAGAPRPLLMRGGRLEEVKIEGTPLGMFPEIEYDTVTLALELEDIVLFASDGILETMNVKNEAFGLDRLVSVLRNIAAGSSAETISAAIIAATDEFSGSQTEAHDDRTLVILRITGKSEKK